MKNQPWLIDRRWRWRVIVLLIVLAVFAALMARGESLLGALAGVVMLFLVAAHVISWIINDDQAKPPALPSNFVTGAFLPAGPAEPSGVPEAPPATGAADLTDLDRAA